MYTHRICTTGIDARENDPEVRRRIVYTMEQVLLGGELIEIKVEHEFADGLYFRKIHLPAGASLTGRVHKQNDLQIVFYGDISILTERGLTRFTGPCSFTSKAGIKPYALAHANTCFATAHHTHLTDLAAIERELFEDEPAHAYDFVSGKIRQEELPCQL